LILRLDKPGYRWSSIGQIQEKSTQGWWVDWSNDLELDDVGNLNLGIISISAHCFELGRLLSSVSKER